jgi:hypothetical protein
VSNSDRVQKQFISFHWYLLTIRTTIELAISRSGYLGADAQGRLQPYFVKWEHRLGPEGLSVTGGQMLLEGGL